MPRLPLTVPRHVVLLSIDTLRFDCVGYQPDRSWLRRLGLGIESLLKTPTFDALASRGTRFSQAISTASYTTNAHASALTGLYPAGHGVRSFLAHQLRDDAMPLAESLREAGFRTILATDTPELFKITKLDRGFDTTIASDDTALSDVLRASHRRTFALIHVFDVHTPYLHSMRQPPPDDSSDWSEMMATLELEFGGRAGSDDDRSEARFGRVVRGLPGQALPTFAAAPYYALGVNKFDGGRLRFLVDMLRDTGILDQGLLVVFSDHGEADYAGRFTHGGALVDDVLRVPLVFVGAGAVPWTCGAQVSVADIAPTVLDVVGMAPSSPNGGRAGGRSLRSALAGAPIPDVPVFAEYWRREAEPNPGNGTSDEAIVRAREWMTFDSLVERLVRYPDRKLIVAGAIEQLADIEPRPLENAELVRKAFRYALDREVGPQEPALIRSLDQGMVSRQAFLRSILDSQEAKQRRAAVTIDLVADPFEQNPEPVSLDELLSSNRGVDWALLNRMNPLPDALTARRQAADLTADERAVLTKRLSDLGYL